MAANRVKGITIEINGDSTKLTKALAAVDNSLKKTQTNLKDLNKLLKLDPGNTELLRQKQEQLASAISSTKDRLGQLKDAQSQVTKGSAEWDALQREIIATQQDLDKLEADMKDFGSVGAQQAKIVGEKFQEIGSKLQAVGDKMSAIGGSLTTKVTAPIVAGLGACAKSASDFEDAMAKVNTIADTSETGVALEDLESQILELSDKTGIASTEIADNVYNAISAGQKTGDAVNFVGEATKLATAGFAESGAALDILTTIMNAYGMEAEDVTRVSDVLISTQNLGKTTVAELSAAMGKAIPTAKSNGVEIEDLAASYAVMTSNGIATAETTTYLNSMLNELGKQGTTAAKAFAAGTDHIKEGGLTMKEAMEQGWELSDVLSILDEQAYVSGTTIANMFGSAEAGKAATVLWDNAEKLNDAVSAMEESAGATDEAFAKMDTTSRQAQIALNQLKNSAIDLGGTVLTMLAPYFEQVVGKIKEVTEWFKNLDEGQKQMIVKIAGIVAAVGPVLMIVGKIISVGAGLITHVGTLLTYIPKIQAALTLLTGPVGIIIAAIGALTAAFIHFYKTNDEFREKVNAVVDAVKEKLGVFIENLKVWIAQAIEYIRPIIEALQGYFSALGEMFGAIATQVATVIGQIAAVIKQFITEHQTEIQAVMTFIETVVKTKIEIIRTIIKTVLDVITNMIKVFTAIIKGDWDGALTHLKNAAISLKDGVVSIFRSLGNALSTIFKDIIGKFKQWGADMINNLISGIKSKIDAVKDTMSSVADAIREFIHFSEPDVGPLSDFHTYAPDMMKLFADGIKQNAHLITDAVGSSFDLRPYINSMTSGINKLTNVTSSSLDSKSQTQPVVVQVSLEGDAQRLFRVLSEEAHRDWQVTGQSRLLGY